MDTHWIVLCIVWAAVEYERYLKKKPYPGRMRTGAWWTLAIGTLLMLGKTSIMTFVERPWWTLFVAISLNGAAVLLVYGLRSLLYKVWCYFSK